MIAPVHPTEEHYTMGLFRLVSGVATLGGSEIVRGAVRSGATAAARQTNKELVAQQKAAMREEREIVRKAEAKAQEEVRRAALTPTQRKKEELRAAASLMIIVAIFAGGITGLTVGAIFGWIIAALCVGGMIAFSVKAANLQEPAPPPPPVKHDPMAAMKQGTNTRVNKIVART